MTERGSLKRALDVESGKAPEIERSYVVPPSRRGKIALAIHVDPSVRAQIKALAGERGTTVQALMAEGLNYVFEKYGKKPIA
jgi:hypothetical protein